MKIDDEVEIRPNPLSSGGRFRMKKMASDYTLEDEF